MTWEKILIRTLDGEKNIPSPFNKKGILESLFVIINKEEKFGYLLIWCSITGKAVQFSRLRVPDIAGINVITSEELGKSKAFKIELQDISIFSKEMEGNMKR
jgi:hypothetical protein